MSVSRLGNKRVRGKKEDPDNPGVRFLYSEAVAKVLRKYGSCVNIVRKRYPSSYLYRDNTDLNLNHLPRLEEHYSEIPTIVPSIQEEAMTTRSLPDPLLGDRKRATTFFLPHINPHARLTPRGGVISMKSPGETIATATSQGGYHRHCLERYDGNHGYAFLTDRRSAYKSRRLPSAFGTPPPRTFSNRMILEKMWVERIPLCNNDKKS